MKALSILQPYAELIASGEKWIENRTWSTHYRGPLAIHAGKSRRMLRLGEDGRDEYGLDPNCMTFGAVVAVAELVDCQPLWWVKDHASNRYPSWIPGRSANDILTHKHCEGPVLWILADARRITPVPFIGAQGLFDFPESCIGGQESRSA